MSGSHLLQYAKKPSGKAPNENLFNHVTKLVQATADSHNPVKGVDKLELLSNHLKQTEFYFKEPEHDKEVRMDLHLAQQSNETRWRKQTISRCCRANQ